MHSWRLYSAPPLGNRHARTMIPFPTQSHYPDTELTSTSPILVMSSARLESDKYQFDKSLEINSRSPTCEDLALPIWSPLASFKIDGIFTTPNPSLIIGAGRSSGGRGLDGPIYSAQQVHLQFGLFSLPTSAPQPVHQRLYYVLPVWESAYKRPLAAYWKVCHDSGFPLKKFVTITICLTSNSR